MSLRKLLIYLADHRRKLVYIPLLLYWLIIFILTTLPAGDLPDVSSLSDKTKHFIAYMMLAVLLNLAFIFQTRLPKVSKYSHFFTFLCAALYGIIDELHQSFIPGRQSDIKDWYADISGSLLGILIVFVIKKITEWGKNLSREETF